MLRRWHRLLAPFFAIFLLFIAATGVCVQITDMLRKQVFFQSLPSNRVVMGQWNHWFKALHSGEIVGLSGELVGLLCGVALCYLSATGLWMYMDMFRRRRRARRRTEG